MAAVMTMSTDGHRLTLGDDHIKHQVTYARLLGLCHK